MSLSNRFSKDLRNCLQNKPRNLYNWEVEFRLDSKTRECVDVGGEPKAGSRGRRTILIEVELRREDPVSNVIKVWRRILDGSFPDGAMLIQGFSRIYRSKRNPTKKLRAESAVIFGKLMAEQHKDIIHYIPLQIDYQPRAGSNEGNGARANAAKRFGSKIAARLNRHKSIGQSIR